MDYRDSPQEAEFRTRLRAWLRDHTPVLPAASTADEYWHLQGQWHQSLYEAGFFGLSWPIDVGGHDLPSGYDAILDDELTAAGAPPRPGVGYLVRGILEHADDATRRRFLPGIVSGRDRWCQGFSEPDAGSDLASLRTRAEPMDGDDGTPAYVITGHKVWTSYSDVADWCLVLARTDPAVPKHKGISAFAVSMRSPGIEQRPIRMINGITAEFGQVIFDEVRVPASNMIGAPGDGWRLAMTVVSHEREPGELGVVSRYAKTVRGLVARVAEQAGGCDAEVRQELAWALVETEMLRLHVCRRLSARLDGIDHGPAGSVDRLLMTTTEQTIGHAALAVEGAGHAGGGQTALKTYLYSRAATVMGGTAQIQRNLIATRLLGLPTA